MGGGAGPGVGSGREKAPRAPPAAGGGVGAGVGLGQAEGAADLAGGGERQPLPLLLLGAAKVDRLGGEGGEKEDQGRGVAVLGDLLHGQGQGEEGGTAAAGLLRNREPEEAD